jgi:hypothetical protein
VSPEIVSFFILIVTFCFAGMIFIALLAIGGIIIYLVIDSIRLAGKSPSIQQTWAWLAQQHQLHFKDGSEFFSFLSEGPEVIGLYRGHKLHLKLVGGRSEYTTRLTLLADPPLTASTSRDAQPIRPAITPEELLQQLAPDELPHPWRGQISIDPQGRMVTYQQAGKETEVAYLQALFNLASDVLEGFPQVVVLGSVAIPALIKLAINDHPLNNIAAEGLQYISRETDQRLGKRAEQLLCANCLVHCAKLPIRLSWWWQTSYFGCRQCGQTHQFLELNHRSVMAVLDSSETARIAESAEQVRLNWFVHDQPFDFDAVEIIQADDEAVERFAVQLGNDTDPARRFRYQTMSCRVAPGCTLSANTLRVLGSIFGQVEVQQQPMEVGNEG